MDKKITCGVLDVEIRQSGPIPLDASFQCARGELLVLVGPSGSGKTTVLRAIAGLMQPAAGKIVSGDKTWFCSDARIDVTPQERRVGFVFQDYALFPHLTAEANVAIAVPGGDALRQRTHAKRLLSQVNLDGLEARFPNELSGGQRQRVALARALAREPDVLLLDEPFSAVDQLTRERLKRELADLREILDIPIVLVTHDLNEAWSLADRISVLHRGRTIQTAAPDDLRLRPLSPMVARLIGHTNLFSGVVKRQSGNAERGLIEWNGCDIEVENTDEFATGAAVSWLIASDQVVLHRRGRPSRGERENPVSGTVRVASRLGEQTLVTLCLEGTEQSELNFAIATHAARRNGVGAGVEVSVSLLASGIHLMAPET